MADWTARMAAAFHSFQSAASHAFQRKIKSTPFAQQNGIAPLNASGVVQVGPRRFVFVDNHDSAAPSTNSRSTPTVRKYIGYGGAQWWALKRDLAWDPRANALLFGQRGPAAPGRISMIQVPVDAGGATWTTAALRTPSILLARIPQSTATQGIRDISYAEQTCDFLILLGRSLSGSDAPFQLCVWNGASNDVRLIDIKFHRSMKPEGITTFSSGGKTRILVVDDGGGYAVVNARHQFTDQ